MSSVELLQEICRSTLPELSSSFHDRRIVAGFYPYIGLTHTIRRRGSNWVIKISDHCAKAPREVLRAIIVLLACKVLRRKAPPDQLQIYDLYRRNPDLERQVRERRRQRGHKQIRSSEGKYHSLAEIYGEVNRKYFNGQIEVRQVGWGARSSWRRLGHYDPTHHTITISPVLDSPSVPRSVLSYLLYHEMLHTLFDGTANHRRQRYHTREFNRAEKAYPGYLDARAFLDSFCRGRKGRGLRTRR